jgi:hypothetical protein
MKPAKVLWIVTAFVETSAGVGLLCLPEYVVKLLLRLESTAQETQVIGRVAGAALLCIGVASWQARNDLCSPAHRGLLAGVLLYNVAAAALLGWAGAGLQLAGIALWPAVGLHAVLAVWCSFVFWSGCKRGDSTSQP